MLRTKFKNNNVSVKYVSLNISGLEYGTERNVVILSPDHGMHDGDMVRIERTEGPYTITEDRTVSVIDSEKISLGTFPDYTIQVSAITNSEIGVTFDVSGNPINMGVFTLGFGEPHDFINPTDSFGPIREEINNDYYSDSTIVDFKGCVNDTIIYNGLIYKINEIDDETNKYIVYPQTYSDSLNNKLVDIWYTSGGDPTQYHIDYGCVPVTSEGYENRFEVRYYYDNTNQIRYSLLAGLMGRLSDSIIRTKDNRFFEWGNDRPSFRVNGSGIVSVTIYKIVGTYSFKIPLSLDSAKATDLGMEFGEYVENSIIPNNISPIVDYEKVRFEPVSYTSNSGFSDGVFNDLYFSNLTKLDFILHLRERYNTDTESWITDETKGWNNYYIESKLIYDAYIDTLNPFYLTSLENNKGYYFRIEVSSSGTYEADVYDVNGSLVPSEHITKSSVDGYVTFSLFKSASYTRLVLKKVGDTTWNGHVYVYRQSGDNNIQLTPKIKQADTNADLLSFFGYNDADIYYRRNKLKKSFIRLSFYDSTDRGSQQLLYYSTIFLDSGDLYDKYIKARSIKNMYDYVTDEDTAYISDEHIRDGRKDLRLSAEFSAYDKYDKKHSSDGFYLYLFPSIVSGTSVSEIYMKVEFNHAKYGRTIPLVAPSKIEDDQTKLVPSNEVPTNYFLMDAEGNYIGNDWARYEQDSYIKLYVKYDANKNRYVWFYPFNNNGNNGTLQTVLYEPRLTGFENSIEEVTGDKNPDIESKETITFNFTFNNQHTNPVKFGVAINGIKYFDGVIAPADDGDLKTASFEYDVNSSSIEMAFYLYEVERPAQSQQNGGVIVKCDNITSSKLLFEKRMLYKISGNHDVTVEGETLVPESIEGIVLKYNIPIADLVCTQYETTCSGNVSNFYVTWTPWQR